jgi:tetratricopeptide (TPR) repeat protein
MSNLALTYSYIGRHHDALVMREETLEFLRRVLPENHPDIGTVCLNLGKSYRKFGDFNRALKVAREALQIYQPTLPPSDPRYKAAQELLRQCEGDVARCF